MGIVYLAKQISLGRLVALKVLPTAAALDPRQLQRFQIEAQAAALLHHGHIVPIHSVGCEKGVHYYAMQYIEGRTLADLIREQRHLLGRDLDDPDEADRKPEPVRDAMASDGPSPAVLSTTLASPSPRPATASAPEPTAPAPNGNGNGTSSTTSGPAYFRTVARLTQQAAEALAHAHQQGVIHRDVKPSNLLIDARGHVWVADFGLARLTNESGPTLTDKPLGTLAYMSPEQAQVRPGVVDHRTDVYSLGVTLYELSTLTRPFPGRHRGQVLHQIAHADPRRPRRHDPRIPRDLETITLKAMSRDPADRYPTAQALADDLARFLDGRPIQGRRAGVPRQFWLWCRRNKGWAAALGIAFVAINLVVALTMHSLKASAAEATAKAKSAKADTDRALAQKDAAEAEAEARAAEDRVRMHKRELLVQELQRLRMSPIKRDGWTATADELLRQIRDLRPDETADLRDQAAAGFVGLDARSCIRFDDFGAQTIAFDPRGDRLLMGLGRDQNYRPVKTRLWDFRSRTLQTFDVLGDGPVGFARDGTPIQVVVEDSAEGLLALIDLPSKVIRTRFHPPGPPAVAKILGSEMTPDGSFVAAAVEGIDGSAATFVWDGESGEPIRTIPGERTALAFSPDGRLLAGGARNGRITVWSLPSGEEVVEIREGRSEITGMAFGRDRLRRDEPTEGPGSGWLLASANTAGQVYVHEVGGGKLRTICRGSYHMVFAVAFSPDGMTLASCGRGAKMIWDLATGQPLLAIHSGDMAPCLAFTPDGKRLAFGAYPAYWVRPRVEAYDLEFDRGIRSFRGLMGQVERTALSADARWMAAISHDWQVGVWDTEKGHLLHVFEAPQGLYTDNAGLAIDPEGKRLAFAAYGHVRMWDLETGAVLRSWSFPPSLQDRLAFHPSGKLLFCTGETLGQKEPPHSPSDPSRHPRVCRMYDLLSPDPRTPLWIKEEFNVHVHNIMMPRDGRHVLVAGLQGLPKPKWVAKVFDGLSGRELGEVPPDLISLPLDNGPKFAADPDVSMIVLTKLRGGEPGKIVSYYYESPALSSLPSRNFEGEEPTAFSPGAAITILKGGEEQREWCRLIRRDGQRLLDLRIWTAPNYNSTQFTPDGRSLVWGTTEGNVHLADLEEIRRRLSRDGLSW